jgi:hypothetical protein
VSIYTTHAYVPTVPVVAVVAVEEEAPAEEEGLPPTTPPWHTNNALAGAAGIGADYAYDWLQLLAGVCNMYIHIQ